LDIPYFMAELKETHLEQVRIGYKLAWYFIYEKGHTNLNSVYSIPQPPC